MRERPPAIQTPVRNRERISLRTNNIVERSRSAPIQAIGCRGKRKGSFSEATRNSRRLRRAGKVRSYRRRPETKNVSRPRSAREGQIPRLNREARQMRRRCRGKRRDDTKSQASGKCPELD